MNVFFLAILLYLLYKFITGFLIPVFRTTRHVRQQFNQMNGKPGAKSQEKQGPSAPETPPSHGSKVGEYIDFEEVK